MSEITPDTVRHLASLARILVTEDEVETLAKELNVIGLMNVQFAVKNQDIFILEVNPRGSRTIPFVGIEPSNDSVIKHVEPGRK